MAVSELGAVDSTGAAFTECEAAAPLSRADAPTAPLSSAWPLVFSRPMLCNTVVVGDVEPETRPVSDVTTFEGVGERRTILLRRRFNSRARRLIIRRFSVSGLGELLVESESTPLSMCTHSMKDGKNTLVR